MNSDGPGSDMTENNTQTILEVAKAVGAHLELSDVLAALISTLKPIVHFDLIGIGILEGEAIRLHTICIEGFRAQGGRVPRQPHGALHARD